MNQAYINRLEELKIVKQKENECRDTVKDMKEQLILYHEAIKKTNDKYNELEVILYRIIIEIIEKAERKKLN